MLTQHPLSQLSRRLSLLLVSSVAVAFLAVLATPTIGWKIVPGLIVVGVFILLTLVRIRLLPLYALALLLPFDRIQLLGPISPSDLALVSCIALLVISGRWAAAWLHFRVPLLAFGSFVVLVSLVTVFNPQSLNPLAPVRTMSAQFALILVTVVMIRSYRELATVHAFYIAGALIAVILGYYQYYEFYTTGEMVFTVDRPFRYISSLDLVILRMSSTLENPVHFAFYLTFPATLSLVYALDSPIKKVGTILKYLIALMLVSGIVFSVSRAAILSFGIVLVLRLTLLARGQKRVLMLASSVALLLIAVAAGLFDAFYDMDVKSVLYRLEGLQATLRSWRYFPVFGQGWEGSILVAQSDLSPHSVILESILYGGIVGLMIFGFGLGWVHTRIFSSLKAMLTQRTRVPSWFTATSLATVAIMIPSLFLDPAMLRKSFWFPMGIFMTSVVLYRKQTERKNARDDGELDEQ